MNKRIVTSATLVNTAHQRYWLAFCNDGTVWRKGLLKLDPWIAEDEFEHIPQPLPAPCEHDWTLRWKNNGQTAYCECRKCDAIKE